MALFSPLEASSTLLDEVEAIGATIIGPNARALLSLL
jgi:hypothetical protein